MEKIKNHEIFFTLIVFLVLYFGHNGQRHYWSISLKVLRCNVYNTSLYNKKMGFGLTTHPILNKYMRKLSANIDVFELSSKFSRQFFSKPLIFNYSLTEQNDFGKKVNSISKYYISVVVPFFLYNNRIYQIDRKW